MNKPVPLIMDCGATTLYNKFVKKSSIGAPGTRLKDTRKANFSFYQTKEFKEFREAYIRFIKRNGKYLDGYINLDVIHNAEETYKSQKYLEDAGLFPIPVFHISCDVKWLERYIEEGYDFICIGGVTPNPYRVVRPILDRIWSNILTDSQGLPLVKVHGLACTSFRLLKRYPWWSVDSASWTKYAAYGMICCPRKKNGEFSFDVIPLVVKISEESGTRKEEGRHFLTIPKMERNHIEEWLNKIGIPIGVEGFKEKMPGVVNDYQYRMQANLYYYQALVESLPKYPWPFKHKIRTGFFK